MADFTGVERKRKFLESVHTSCTSFWLLRIFLAQLDIFSRVAFQNQLLYMLVSVVYKLLYRILRLVTAFQAV